MIKEFLIKNLIGKKLPNQFNDYLCHKNNISIILLQETTNLLKVQN
jgi:hypothetical protein